MKCHKCSSNDVTRIDNATLCHRCGATGEILVDDHKVASLEKLKELLHDLPCEDKHHGTW